MDPDQARRLCRAWSGSKLFAKVISSRQKSPLVGKELTIIYKYYNQRSKQKVSLVSLLLLEHWLKLQNSLVLF